jgi:hypothetical protein
MGQNNAKYSQKFVENYRNLIKTRKFALWVKIPKNPKFKYTFLKPSRGGQPKLVFGPELENFAKIIGFLGRMVIKT